MPVEYAWFAVAVFVSLRRLSIHIKSRTTHPSDAAYIASDVTSALYKILGWDLRIGMTSFSGYVTM